MDIIQALKEELQIGRNQVEAAVKLIDEGNTIPFIARYRKEATGSLNDEVLRQLDERLRYLRNLEDKKEQVIGTIRAQEKLTPALEKQIRDAATLVAVEDLYLPYRPKRRTRAGIAREKGLEPLAVWIYKQEAGGSMEAEAAKYVSEEKGVADVSEAIDGARDILAEQISEWQNTATTHVKRRCRTVFWRHPQRMRRYSRCTRCTIISPNQSKSWRDTVCWRSTAVRKRRF